MDTAANPNSAGPQDQTGRLVESATTLDEDLRQRLAAVDAEERGGAERFGSARPMLLEGAVWLAVGAAIWVLAILVWR